MTKLIKDIGNVVPDVQIVIKSTLPIGYSQNIYKETGLNITFTRILRKAWHFTIISFHQDYYCKTSEMHQSEPYLSVIKRFPKNYKYFDYDSHRGGIS